MRSRKRLTLVCGLLLSLSGGVQAQDGDEDDLAEVLMQLLPENAAVPTAMTKTLELPPAVDPESPAQERSAAGRAKERLVEGLRRAEAARERGEEFGQSMAEDATQNRENFTRGSPPDRPEAPPAEPPGRP